MRWNPNENILASGGNDNNIKIWDGQSNRGLNKNRLPDDTYFYIINLGDGSPQLSGFIVLKNN